MSEKIFNTRIQHKHDIEANWSKAINFIPKQGELIVYDKDQNHSQIRLKIGDGTTKINDLPFSIDEILIGTTEEITPTQVAEAIETGRNVSVTYNDVTYGAVVFSSFTKSHGFNGVFSSEILYYAGAYVLVELYGNTDRNDWELLSTQLAQYNDISAPLIGATDEVTPSQVAEAIEAGQDVAIAHTSIYGRMLFANFSLMNTFDAIASSAVLNYEDTQIVLALFGQLSTNQWFMPEPVALATKNDIPSALPNPESLTFKPGTNALFGELFPISYNGESAQTVYLPTKTSHLENDSGFVTEDKLPKALHVTILDNGDGTGTSDKTYEEILAAYENGSAILGRIDTAGQTCMILNMMTYEVDLNAFAVTGIAGDGLYWAAIVTKDEGILVGNLPLIQSPVIGTTAEITPSQIKALMDEGKPFAITHTDSTYGSMLFNSFVYSQVIGDYILSSTVFQFANIAFCAQLFGNFSSDTWEFSAFKLAKSEDIPTALKNPHALTINGTKYDGSEAKTISGLATETYVNNKVASMVDSAPEALNTLNELAAALGDDPNFATTIAGQIGSKIDKTDIDATLSDDSTNPVQNKVVKDALDKKPGEIVTGKTYTIDGSDVVAGTGAEIFNNSSNIASGAYSHAEGKLTEATGSSSHAEGQSTIASGACSHAEGYRTKATGNYSHAEGYGGRSSQNVVLTGAANATIYTYMTNRATNFYPGDFFIVNGSHINIVTVDRTARKIIVDSTLSATEVKKQTFSKYRNCQASGAFSHAEGQSTIASDACSHAEGNWTIALGESSHAEGSGTIASGESSHAEGNWTIASGRESHAEGYSTEATGINSHAEGYGTEATGDYSHAEGLSTIATSDCSHAEGQYNIEDSENKYVHIIGNGNRSTGTRSNAHTVDWEGNAWYAGDVYVGSTSGTNKDEGSKKLATEDQVNNKVDKIEGKGLSTNDYTDTEKNKLAGIAEGANKTIVDTYLNSTSTNPVQNKVVKDALDKKPGEKVEGKTYTIDDKAVTAATGAEIFNYNNTATGYYSHAEGVGTQATGDRSHAEGGYTKASGSDSHAEGYYTIASNDCAHSEGYCTTASGNNSHAEGEFTQAISDRSHAEGYYTIASSYGQHVQGRLNIEDTEDKLAHIVGNGISSNGMHTRSNAHTLDWKGNAWFAGDVYVKSSSGHNKDRGSKKLATEDQVNNKVDKVSGKGLSTNDYTNTDKTKLDNTNIAYGTCSTAAATAEKVVVLNGNTQWSLKTGSIVMVKFDVSNTAENVKINVNNTGAYPIWYNNAEYTGTGTAYTGYANRTITYMFNGTHYVWITASYDANSTYTNAALGQGYATCSTAAATTAKVGSLSSYKLVTGGIVAVKFTNSVPANATLNINSTGAKSIYYKGAKITGDIIKAGEVATFVYSTYYHLISIDRCDQKALTINGVAYDGSAQKTIETGIFYINYDKTNNSFDKTLEQIEAAYQEKRQIVCVYPRFEPYVSFIPLSLRGSAHEWEFSGWIDSETYINIQNKDEQITIFENTLSSKIEQIVDQKIASITNAEGVSF